AVGIASHRSSDATLACGVFAAPATASGIIDVPRRRRPSISSQKLRGARSLGTSHIVPPTSSSAVMSIAASPASCRPISHSSFLPCAGGQNSHFIRLTISKYIVPGRGQYRRFQRPSSFRQMPPHQALYKGEQQHNHGQSYDRPGDRPREKYGPIVREADH